MTRTRVTYFFFLTLSLALTFTHSVMALESSKRKREEMEGYRTQSSDSDSDGDDDDNDGSDPEFSCIEDLYDQDGGYASGEYDGNALKKLHSYSRERMVAWFRDRDGDFSMDDDQEDWISIAGPLFRGVSPEELKTPGRLRKKDGSTYNQVLWFTNDIRYAKLYGEKIITINTPAFAMHGTFCADIGEIEEDIKKLLSNAPKQLECWNECGYVTPFFTTRDHCGYRGSTTIAFAFYEDVNVANTYGKLLKESARFAQYQDW